MRKLPLIPIRPAEPRPRDCRGSNHAHRSNDSQPACGCLYFPQRQPGEAGRSVCRPRRGGVRQLGVCEHLGPIGRGAAASTRDHDSFLADGRLIQRVAGRRYLLLFGTRHADGHGGIAQILRQQGLSIFAVGRAASDGRRALRGHDRRGSVPRPLLRHRRSRRHWRPMHDRRPYGDRKSCPRGREKRDPSACIRGIRVRNRQRLRNSSAHEHRQ